MSTEFRSTREVSTERFGANGAGVMVDADDLDLLVNDQKFRLEGPSTAKLVALIDQKLDAQAEWKTALAIKAQNAAQRGLPLPNMNPRNQYVALLMVQYTANRKDEKTGRTTTEFRPSFMNQVFPGGWVLQCQVSFMLTRKNPDYVPDVPEEAHEDAAPDAGSEVMGA